MDNETFPRLLKTFFISNTNSHFYAIEKYGAREVNKGYMPPPLGKILANHRIRVQYEEKAIEKYTMKERIVKALFLLTLIIAFASCAASAGNPKDLDFLTKHVSANIAVADACANLRQGFRYCGPARYGVLECRQPAKDGTVQCNVSIGGEEAKGANTPRGMIKLSPSADGTKAVFKINNNAVNKEETLVAWEIFMSGRAREACP